MELVLSTAMHRRIRLITLLSTANSWVYLDEIAVFVDSSKKTVISDCKYIEERWPDVLTIETSQKNGVRLLEAANRSIHDIYIEIIRESNAFLLLETVFFNPGMSDDYFEKKFFLSNSSLYRVTKNLNQALSKRNIQLKRNPYHIIGKDERQIRYFFSSYFLEVYGIHEWPFALDRKKVFALAEKLNTNLQLKLNDLQLADLVFSMVVTIFRERQGFLVDNREVKSQSFHDRLEKVRAYTKEMAEIITPLNVPLPDNWYNDFCYSIFWWEFGWDNTQEKKRIEELSEKLLETISSSLKITLSNESDLKIKQMLENIYAKHKMFPYKKYIVYNREVFSSAAIKQSYIVFTEVVSKALKDLEIKNKFPWYSMYFDEILHQMFTRWENLPEQLEGLRHQIRIGVFSDLSKEHAELLAYFLRKNFREKIRIAVQDRPFYDLEESHFPEMDLYVSNFAIKNVPSQRLFIVQDMPSFKNLVDLRRIIDKSRLVLPKDIPYLNE